MPDWINNPRYQRVIQKLQGLPSWQRAIFTSAGADRQFASDEMRNKINAINAASRKKEMAHKISYGKERLDLSRDAFKASSKIRDRRWDIDKGDRRTAEMLGYGNIGLSGIMGYKEMELANLQAAQEQAMRKKLISGINPRIKY